MANRYPLIGNSVTKRLEELAADDNLNLSGSGIYDGTGVGNDGQILYSTGEGIEWRNVPEEIDTTYSLSAVDGTDNKKIIRLTDVNLVETGVTLVPGENISLTRSNDEITITSSYTDTDTITSIKGGPTGEFVTGNVTLAPTGSVFMSQVGTTITIGASDTNTITRLRGGSGGSFVTGDVTISGSNAASVSQAGNTINVSSTDTVTRIKGGVSGSFTTGDITFIGGGAASVTQNSQTVTITSPNTTYGVNVSDTSFTVKTISLVGSDNTSVDVTFTAGTGVLLEVNNNDITFSVDVANINLANLGDTSISNTSNSQVLKLSEGIWINDTIDYSEIGNTPTLSAVAGSGEYTDLLNAPVLAEVATSGSYADLINLPTLVTDASDLTDINNRFFSGNYEDLSNAPLLASVATSGDYFDLSNLPIFASVATSGDYTDLNNLPTIPPDRSYIVSAETDTNGAVIRLREINTLDDDDLLLVSGTGMSVTRTDENTINIASTLNGLPSGVSATTSTLVFEGSVVDSFKTTLSIANPTANRTLTFPDATGTLVINSTNKTYAIDVIDTSSNFYEGKIGLQGSNTGASTYAIVAGVGGLKVDSDAVAGSQQSSGVRSLTITPPPSVHMGTTAPEWAKNGDLWYNNVTGVLKVFDESLYPTADATVDYFQSVESGQTRFYCDRVPQVFIPAIDQFIVAPGIPTGTYVLSNFDPATGSNVGWFNLSTAVTTNIPHNATIRVYNSNPNVNINNIWRTLYDPTPSKLLQSRTSSSVTTAGTLNQDQGENITFTGFKSYALLKVQTNVSSWITLYTSDAARIADASRTYGNAAPENSGIIADVTTSNNQTLIISPGKIGFTDDASTTIYARVVNKSAGPTQITSTITLLKLED